MAISKLLIKWHWKMLIKWLKKNGITYMSAYMFNKYIDDRGMAIRNGSNIMMQYADYNVDYIKDV